MSFDPSGYLYRIGIVVFYGAYIPDPFFSLAYVVREYVIVKILMNDMGLEYRVIIADNSSEDSELFHVICIDLTCEVHA